MNSNKQRYGLRRNGSQHGDVFTKPEVVNFMLDLVGYLPSSNLSSVSIMEPSCGEGGFLLEIIKRLCQSSIIYNFDFNEACHSCIHACEIDQDKIVRCKGLIQQIYPQIASVDDMISHEDYLLGQHPAVDIIVGNPPYIRYEEIPEDKLNIYKSQFKTFYYRSDMYVLFFEKTLSELKPGGKHSFICANRWMRNQYGKKLRLLIAKYLHINEIINMEAADTFQEEVLAYPAITYFSNEQPSDSFSYSDLDLVKDLSTRKSNVVNTPTGDDWSGVFVAEEETKYFCLIEEQGFSVGIGVATGADSIFISKDLQNQVETDLIIPAINARDLQGNEMIWGGKYLLNPYSVNGELISLTKYPKAKAYLELHQERLKGRHKAKKTPSRWYATIDNIYPTLQKEPKIFLPDISANSYIFVDEGRYYPLHNIYYIKGGCVEFLKALAALLMSDFVRNQLNNLTNRMNGGYPRWQSQYVKKLRVPTLSIIPKQLLDKLILCYENFDIKGINDCTSDILKNEKMVYQENPRPRKKVQPQLSFDFV